MESNKRALFITNCFPPYKFASSPQIGRLTAFLSKNFETMVLTIDSNNAIDESMIEMIADVNVKRVRKSFLLNYTETMKGNILRQNILPDSFYFNHFVLLKSAYNIIKDQKTNVIFTFGMPMSTHLVGLKLKKQFPNIKWISVFNDPWVDNPFNNHNAFVSWLNNRYQKLVFKNSNSLVFSSEEYKTYLTTKYPNLVEKMHYIPLSFANTNLQNIQKNDKLLIRYIGNFYGERQPDCLFKALRKIPQEYLDSIRVELIGTSDKDLRKLIHLHQLSEVVCIKDEVSYLESLQLMRYADLLLLIDAPLSHNIFLPSKLVEYIGARKPIFAITPRGTSKKLIDEMGFLVANPKDIGDISSKLCAAIDRIKNGYALPFSDSIIKRYAIETIAHQYLEVGFL